MAITRAQQARQMLKKGTSKPVVQGGVDNYLGKQPQVVAPRKWQSGPDKPPTELAYITEAEKKLLLKEDIHGSLKKGPNVGPSGIMSLDSFGDADGSGMAGGDVSRAERGDFGPIGGGGGPELPPGVKRKTKPTKTEQDLRSAFIAAGGGQRVNPGFFDSRNRISPKELELARQFTRRGDPTGDLARSAMRRTRGGGIMGFLTSGGILGNLLRGLGQAFGFGKRFNQPTYDMSKLSGLPLGGSAAFQNLDIRDKFDRTADDDEDENINLNDYQGLTNLDFINRISERDMSLTPEQKQLIEEDQLGNIDDLMAFKPGSTKDRQLKQMYNIFQETGMEDPRMRNLMQEDIEGGAPLSLPSEAYQLAADGGLIGGGIMDAAGRQQYFLGKLVKKAKRAVKKIVKSPIGKLGLGAALAFTPFGKAAIGKFAGLSPGMKALIGGVGLSSLPLIFGKQEEQQPTGFTGSVGGQIDSRAYTDPYSVLFGAFKAEGGSMKDEPVAKRTMPLLDMGGQEMDLRAEGGFVPIGRMEKADDVPARLSKNEFVFTADAVRNAGDGDVDKGAEVMYNMMKNLEAGGDVSEESQGKEGARRMFQTSQRLEEVL